MAGRPPDDALARLARWDELRRRAAAGRPAPAARAAAQPTAPAALPVMDDVERTLQELVARHPALSLAVVAEQGGVVWRLHITPAEAAVTVAEPPPPPLPPAPAPPPSAAARLADLLRDRPGLLDDRG